MNDLTVRQADDPISRVECPRCGIWVYCRQSEIAWWIDGHINIRHKASEPVRNAVNEEQISDEDLALWRQRADQDLIVNGRTRHAAEMAAAVRRLITALTQARAERDGALQTHSKGDST